MLAVPDRFEADLPVAEMDFTSSADLTRLLEPSASASPSAPSATPVRSVRR
jgi:hypothetical protein